MHAYEHEFVDAQGGYDGWGGVAVADFDGDGVPEFATGGKGGGFYHLYDYDPAGDGWTRDVTTAFSPNVGAAATDVDGDGDPEIVTGEMENGKTDGVETTPEWFYLDRTADGWEPRVVLDANLGIHSGVVADFTGNGALDIVGKVWRANETNSNGGRNHVDCLHGEPV